MREVVKVVVFIWAILIFVQQAVGEVCTIVHEDNEGAIQLVNNPLSSGNSNHIDVRHD